MATTKKDYYEILGASREASADELKKAYRKMAVKYHPDKNPGNKEAEDKFKEVSEAYEVLSNPDKKAAYDRYGHAAFQQGGMGGGNTGSSTFHDPFEIFREVFGSGGGGSSIFGDIFEDAFGGNGGQGNQPSRGADLRYDLEITLEESVNGIEKEISVRKLEQCSTCDGSGAAPGSKTISCSTCGGTGRVSVSRGFFSMTQTCPTCQGSGVQIEKPCAKCNGEGRLAKTSKIKIKVPPGVDTGSRLRSSNNGEAGTNGGPYGDLYIVIHVKDHAIFEREDTDLYCKVPVSFTRAALGGEVEVPTLEGKAIIKIPEGTPSGKTFRLKGKGVPDLRGYGRGDLNLRLYVEVPSKLTSDQKKKLQEFSDLCDDNNHPERQSFFAKAKEFFK
ncbi:MAG: molecular chaperone DnaJ [Verrucomicrobiota bacterium]